MGGNSVAAGPAGVLRGQPQQQQPGRSAAVPAASGIGARAAVPAASGIGGIGAAPRSARQPQVKVKQEPLSQPAGPGAAQQSQQPPAAQFPCQQAQRLDRDVPFAELAQLPGHSLVQLVGYLRRKPEVKVRRHCPS